MRDIADAIDTIFTHFERLLRWFYPGGLILVLLWMSRPTDFNRLADGATVGGAVVTTPSVDGPWDLIVGALIAGFAAYLIQHGVINQVMSLLWPPLVPEGDAGQGSVGGKRSRVLEIIKIWHWLDRRLDRVAENTRNRWSDGLPKNLQNYLNYAWGVHHAVMMTGWLTFVFFFINDSDSFFDHAPDWSIYLVASLLLLGGVVTCVHLHRVQTKHPPDADKPIS